MTENQNPEQKARDKIDALLKQAGWKVRHKRNIDLNDGPGQAVREFQTDIGPADFVLFVDKKPVGVIEAKRAEEGQNITAVELQSEGYAAAKLKWVNNKNPGTARGRRAREGLSTGFPSARVFGWSMRPKRIRSCQRAGRQAG